MVEEKKEEKKEEVKEEKKKEFELVEIPTEMGMAIRTPDEEVISESQLLVLIANKLEEIKKGVLG